MDKRDKPGSWIRDYISENNKVLYCGGSKLYLHIIL